VGLKKKPKEIELHAERKKKTQDREDEKKRKKKHTGVIQLIYNDGLLFFFITSHPRVAKATPHTSPNAGG
jgi:hypothetical protein